ncbi:hypothetical protein CF651_02830 [Paenibacillus rigui]|uniref:DUF1405 domain-containing protein n=2 Tax=Paenibacillus rigui TaxID=554312 RepID=A0A229UY66_9BACL|nr:hypothetical protein CF651_02830 [Paenibacillus rigui]
MLWSMFWVNFLGTIYGYIWYGKQLEFTAQKLSFAYLPFVPDSPTASLFFIGTLVYLLVDSYKGTQNPKTSWFRGFVEVFGVITSFKYGIWAVSMIWAAAYQGDGVSWQDWMLTISHLGMAAEAILYVSLYTYRKGAILAVASWAFANDYMDYGVGVFPWLPKSLWDELPGVAAFTIALSIISIIVSILLMKARINLQKQQV